MLLVFQYYYTQPSPAIVKILKVIFESCYGDAAGAMLILQNESSVYSSTVINNCIFSQNFIIRSCVWAAISSNFYFRDLRVRNIPFTVTNTTFSSNGLPSYGQWKSGAIGVRTSGTISNAIHFYFYKITFYNNTSQRHGSCILADTYLKGSHKWNDVVFLLASIKAIGNEGIVVPTDCYSIVQYQ